jgi:heme/copper-type cytochrome/quinol oxidase subunit 2
MELSNKRVLITSLTMAAGAVLVLTGAAREPQVREVNVRADNYAFSPSRIEVQKDEIVKVTFTAVDIPHSFTIDGYRISKRAAAGQSVTFEFRADRSGPFPFYCNLSQDDGCKKMHGELTVK